MLPEQKRRQGKREFIFVSCCLIAVCIGVTPVYAGIGDLLISVLGWIISGIARFFLGVVETVAQCFMAVMAIDLTQLEHLGFLEGFNTFAFGIRAVAVGIAGVILLFQLYPVLFGPFVGSKQISSVGGTIGRALIFIPLTYIIQPLALEVLGWFQAVYTTFYDVYKNTYMSTSLSFQIDPATFLERLGISQSPVFNGDISPLAEVVSILISCVFMIVILGDLFEAIKNEPVLRKVYNILTPLVNGSLSVYNRHTNVDLDNKYIVFDMNGTKGQNLVLSMFITLDFVWSKIKENRLAKKAVFIDEAWQLMGSQANEMAAEYVKEIFKTIRAFGGSAFVMTQDVNDFFSLKDGEYGKAIISNSDTKICLHLDETEANTVCDIMDVSDEELKKITNLQKGNGLVATGNTKLFVYFRASEFEKDVITTDPQYLRQKLREEAARQAELEEAYISDEEPLHQDPVAEVEPARQVVLFDDDPEEIGEFETDDNTPAEEMADEDEPLEFVFD